LPTRIERELKPATHPTASALKTHGKKHFYFIFSV